MMRTLVLAVMALFVVSMLPASATVYPTAGIGGPPSGSGSAMEWAQKMMRDPSQLESASWIVAPPTSTALSGIEANGWSTTTITPSFGVPDGNNFSIMTSGLAAYADDPNSAGSTSFEHGSQWGGGFDVSIIGVTIDVPPAHTCLQVDVQFLSEEFPEYLGQIYNDAFLAELDYTVWLTVPDPTSTTTGIVSPFNFAYDAGGNPLSINAAGVAAMSATDAVGSTYDGATPRVVAQTPITGGLHTIYFSIFDAGDPIFDSAAFIDNMRTFESQIQQDDNTCSGIVTPPPPPPPPPCSEENWDPEECDPPKPPLPPKTTHSREYEHRYYPGYGDATAYPRGVSNPNGGWNPLLDRRIEDLAHTNSDGDNFDDDVDRCPGVASKSNVDTDGDGLGDACDLDDDNDGLQDGLDGCPTDPDPACANAGSAGSGSVQHGERSSYEETDVSSSAQRSTVSVETFAELESRGANTPWIGMAVLAGALMLLLLAVARRRQ